MPEPHYAKKGATFSEDKKYRYTLWREWDPVKPSVAFVMLNPSTADERVLDPTLRRCLGYAREWGYGRMDILNLFALRSTDPRVLYAHRDPIGQQNDEYTRSVCVRARTRVIIAAWGVHGKFMNRDQEVTDLITETLGQRLYYLQLTNNGIPSHPLYLKGSLRPVLYKDRKL
jgi:hypothetical protein